MEQRIGPWRVEVDVDATSEAFERMHTGGPEECGCAPCRNFVSGRGNAYPPEAHALFERLGIRFDRETEVCDLGPCGPGDRDRAYSGWFHFVGRLLEGPMFVDASGAMKYVQLAGPFSFGVRAGHDVLPDAFVCADTLQLEFTTEIPWTLQERPE